MAPHTPLPERADDQYVRMRKSRELVYFYGGEDKCRPEHSWGPGIRPYILMHYVVSGKGVFLYGGTRYELGAGSLFFIFPDTISHYIADAKDPWHYCWITFGGTTAGYYLSRAGITPKTPVLISRSPHKTHTLLREMLGAAGGEPSIQMIRTGCLYQFLGHLMESQEAPQSRPGAAAYFDQAAEYIRLHYSNRLTVEETAKHVGIDRKYLYRIFKNICGLSCEEYIIRLRMNRACELMHNKELGIGNIACSVGYGDAMLFSKTFKRHFGMTPTQYRRKSAE